MLLPSIQCDRGSLGLGRFARRGWGGARMRQECKVLVLSNFWRLEQLFAVLAEPRESFAFLSNFWAKYKARDISSSKKWTILSWITLACENSRFGLSLRCSQPTHRLKNLYSLYRRFRVSATQASFSSLLAAWDVSFLILAKRPKRRGARKNGQKAGRRRLENIMRMSWISISFWNTY